MAILHHATLTPTKLELLAGWLPRQEWFPGSSAKGLARVAAFRFDDPAGEVGIETLLVRVAGGPVLQVPLTYRGAPLPGGEASLVGTTEHSVLGTRWVYDGEGDPVYRDEVTRVIVEGGSEVELHYETAAGPEPKDGDAWARGSGVRAVVEPVETTAADLNVVRVLDGTAQAPQGAGTLTATWVGHEDVELVAALTLRS